MGSIATESTSMSSPSISTDYLVIGAGPAGASLACFLARYNLRGLLVSSASGPAKTPRAHVTNPPALECLRDLDLAMYEECARLGNTGDFIKHYRWCETMAGEEYARQLAWGNGNRKGEYEQLTPCQYMDLPQNLLEPVLLKWASSHDWSVRFDTTMLDFVEEDEGDEQGRKIVASLVDKLTGQRYSVRTKYLFGADGGRSTIANKLDLPFTDLPGGGFAYNVLFRADLTHLMKHREGNLHMIMRLDKDFPFISMLRQVQSGTEWMLVIMPKGPEAPNPKRSFEEWAVIAKDHIGDDSVDVEVFEVSGWKINETSADVISRGNVFCLGDAIHRHPPTLGLGSNTCIQDAFNLAWKIAMVEQKLANPSLLSTYNTERQPVGQKLVKESNDCLRFDLTFFLAIGLKPYGISEEDIKKNKEGLAANTKEGRERRKAIRDGAKMQHNELHAIGTAMGQQYQSFAIRTQDEDAPFKPSARELENPVQYYDPSTYPGRRLPHAWLGKKIPGPLVSTLDVAGKGRFTLFTGIGGDGWKDAAAAVQRELGVAIKVAGIGRGLEWEDTYFDWADKCGVEEDGCVLVRPDLFVAWRAQESGDEAARLLEVMRGVLGFVEEDAEKEETNGKTLSS